MRALVLIATLLWGGASWWWYTCEIKGYCEDDAVQVVANNKEESTATQPIEDKAEIEPAEVATISNAETSSATIDSSKQESPDAEKTVSDEEKTNAVNLTDVASDTDIAKPDEAATDILNDTQELAVEEEAASSKDAVIETVETTVTDSGDVATEAAVTDSVDAVTEAAATDNSDVTVDENTATDDKESTEDAADSSDTVQTDAVEEIVSEDDNDPKKIRIDIVSGESTANIKKARIYFPYSSSKKADLTGSATRYFDKLVEALKADSSLKIQLTGHTDNKGQAKRNQTLGLRRAETVKKILVGKGISAKQIETDSKGEDQPLWSNKREAGRNKNRRVAVEVITE